MEKIPTLFDRDWQGKRGVIDALVAPPEFPLGLPTEKVDGTNVRLTVRNHQLMRVEKRRNPDKAQKAAGITEPWYVEIDRENRADLWIAKAADQTPLADVPNGEWSGEAVGPHIQGNPLDLGVQRVILFSLPAVRLSLHLPDAPCTFVALRDYLPRRSSTINPAVMIEGIVWHLPDGRTYKIKTKDFK